MYRDMFKQSTELLAYWRCKGASETLGSECGEQLTGLASASSECRLQRGRSRHCLQQEISVTHVLSLPSVVGHFLPEYQCRSSPRHRLSESIAAEPDLPLQPGGGTAQRGQTGGGSSGCAISHQGLPGKANLLGTLTSTPWERKDFRWCRCSRGSHSGYHLPLFLKCPFTPFLAWLGGTLSGLGARKSPEAWGDRSSTRGLTLVLWADRHCPLLSCLELPLAAGGPECGH